MTLPQDLQLVHDFARHLGARLGARLERISLFGSRARRDHAFRSDYDLLLVVSKPTGAVRSTIHHEATLWELAHNVDLSTKIVSDADFARLLPTAEPFWKNFRRDELQLWPTNSTPG